MPDNLTNLLRESKRAATRSVRYSPDARPVTDLLDQALALAEQQQAVVALIGTVALCPDCDGTRTGKRKRDGVHACCRLGHASDCQCALCRWISAEQRWEKKEIAQQAEIASLKAIVDAVDDALIVNWIDYGHGDYRKALHDLVSGAIREHDSEAALRDSQLSIARMEATCGGQAALDAQAEAARLREALKTLHREFAMPEPAAHIIRAALSDAAAPARECPNCGHDVQAAWLFCPTCGEDGLQPHLKPPVDLTTAPATDASTNNAAVAETDRLREALRRIQWQASKDIATWPIADLATDALGRTALGTATTKDCHHHRITPVCYECTPHAPTEATCADPGAPVVSCAICGGDIHTCERTEAVGGDYRCPLHPNGVEQGYGQWSCSRPECDAEFEPHAPTEAEWADLGRAEEKSC